MLFGEMAVLMTNMDRKNSKFQAIIDETNSTMRNMKLNEEL